MRTYLCLAVLATLVGSFTQAATLVAQWDDFSGLAVGAPKAADVSTAAYYAAAGVLPSLALSSTGVGTVNSDGSLSLDGAWLDVQGVATLPYPFTVVMTVDNVDTTAERTFFSSGCVSGTVTTYIALSANASGKFKSYWNKSDNANGAFVDRAGLNTLALPGGAFTFVAERQNATLKVQIAGTSSTATDSGLSFGGFTSSSALRIGGSHPVAGNTATQRTAKYTIRRLAIYKDAFTAAEITAGTVYTSNPTWIGTSAGSGTWDLTAENLAWRDGGAQIAFANGKPAAFKDLSGVAQAMVTVAGTVSPASMVFDHSGTDYLVTGSGSIGGTGSLTKRGTGTLTFENANTFSDGLVIEGGRVVERALHVHGGTLGTGKNAWASKVTLRNGTFDLNNAENYRNNAQDGADYWAWLTTQTLTVGGMPGTATIENGTLGLGVDPALVYDATGNPGMATIAARWTLTGSTGAGVVRTVNVGDSSATEVELDFTGGLSGEDFLEGYSATIVKAGAGTMRISCENYFPGLTINAGKVLINSAQALGKRHSVVGNNLIANTVTVNAALDLGGHDQTIEYLAGSAAGSITSAEPATLTIGHASETKATTYSGSIGGAVSLAKTGTTTLTLAGPVITTGSFNFPEGAQVTLKGVVAADPDAAATVQLGSVPVLAGLTVEIADALLLGVGDHPFMSWGEAAPLDFVLPEVTGLLDYQQAVLNADRTALMVRVTDLKPMVTVMPLGDSITEGSSGSQNYRGPLSQLMLDAGYRPDFVGPRTIKPDRTITACAEHCGWSGARIAGAGTRTGLLDNIDTYLDVTGYPDVILLMIGTNDLTAGLSADDAFAVWVKLVQRITLLRPYSQLIVTSVLPFPANDDKVAVVPAFNAKVAALFTDGALNADGLALFGTGARISFVDQYTAVPQDGVNYLDALHPNWVGHQKVAETWLAGIQRVLSVWGAVEDATILRAVNSLDLAQKTLTLTYNKEVPEPDVTAFSFTGAHTPAVTAAVLENNNREVTLTLGDALIAGQPYTINGFTFTARTLGPEGNVAAELMDGYVRVKTLAVPTDNTITYGDVLADGDLPETFDRIGYYLELVHVNNPNDLRYIWVSMDAFTANIAQVGVPTSFTLQQQVSNLQVDSNAPNVRGVTGSGVSGIIEFTPNSIGSASAGKDFPADPGAGFYGWDDAIAASKYGAMQIFRIYGEGESSTAAHPAETLFAFNRWTDTAATNELGIGTFGTHLNGAGGTVTASVDWIFTSGLPNFDASFYTVRNMAFYVRPTVSLNLYWTAGNGTWEAADAWQTAEEGGSPASFSEYDSATLTASGCGEITLNQAVVARQFAVNGDYSFTGSGDLTVLQETTQAADTTLTLDVPFTSGLFTMASGAALNVTQPAIFSAGIVGAGRVVAAADTTVNLAGFTAKQTMPAYTATAGTLTISKPQSGDGIFTGAPSFIVAEGAKLILSGNDVVGWAHANTVNIGTISGTLEKQVAANETFSGQLTLLGNANVVSTSAADSFKLFNSCKMLVPGENADVIFRGHRFMAANGTIAFDVTDATSKLTFNAALNVAAPVSKTGSGELVLAGAVIGSGDFTVNAGTATINGAWTGGGIISAGANGTIRGTGSLTGFAANGWLRGAGTFEGGINGAGTFTTDQFRPFPGARLRVKFSEDGTTCGLFKTGSLLFGSAESTLTVTVDGGTRAKGLRYKIMEATGAVTLGDSPGVVLSGNVAGWLVEKEFDGAVTTWYLKRKPGTVISLY